MIDLSLTKEQWEVRVKHIVETIGTRQALKRGENPEIFDLHNLAANNKWMNWPWEHGRSCNSCLIRTFERLKDYVRSITPVIPPDETA